MLEIQVMMTLALVFYGTAIYLGRNQKRLQLRKRVHISLALTGFILDMIATWKMEMLSTSAGDADWNILLPHTVISTIAILAFLVMLALGYTNRIAIHRVVVYYIFIPSWLLAYGSGIFLIQTM